MCHMLSCTAWASLAKEVGRRVAGARPTYLAWLP
jgi:hypothetical protein